MNRKLIFHLCMLVTLACLAGLVWTSTGPGGPKLTPEEIEAALAAGTAQEDPLTGEVVLEAGTHVDGRARWDWRVILMILVLVAMAGYAAVVFIVFILPVGVQHFTTELLGSEEQVEEDAMHDARALYAQGDFQGAIEAYREVAREEPENRFPWIEIAKIQRDNLENVDGAIRTLRRALESCDWRVNDAAFFMFRLVDLYHDDKQDKDTAVGILKQVVEMFPETRHSANATHRLRDLGAL